MGIRKILILLTLSLSLTISSNQESRSEIEYTPRGVVALALLNSAYPAQDLYHTLRDLKHPAFAFVHRAFGGNYGQFQEVVGLLDLDTVHDPLALTIVVYADCGVCRPPRRRPGQFPIIAPELSINALNKRLESGHQVTLRKFSSAYLAIKRKLIYRTGITYIIHPSLEDNLTARAHNRLHTLLASIFRDEIMSGQVILGRNPSNHLHSEGIVESHDYSISGLKKLRSGDILTSDGIYIATIPSGCSKSQMSIRQARRIAQKALNRGIPVLIWSPQHQGIAQCSTINQPTLPLDQREYIIYDMNGINQILQ